MNKNIRIIFLPLLLALTSACATQRRIYVQAPENIEQAPAPEAAKAETSPSEPVQISSAPAKIAAPTAPKANLLPPENAHTGPVALRIRTAGDTMLGNAAAKRVPDFNPLMPVLDLLRDADLSFVNLEGPICDIEDIESKCEQRLRTRKQKKKRKEKQETESKCYDFRSPSVCADYLKEAGIDAVSMANNHVLDFDVACASAGYNILLNRNIKPFGYKLKTGDTDASTLTALSANGLSTALAGFNFSASGGRLLPVQDIQRAAQLVREARKRHDIVIAVFHAGGEGPDFSRIPQGTEFHFTENRGDVRAFARAMVDAGAALVVGHSPHVLRGMELYKGKLIAYSLGNFATYAGFNLQLPNGLGAILEAALDADGNLVYGNIFSTIQTYSTCAGKPCTKLARDPQERALKEVRKLSLADFPNSPLRIAP